MWLLSTDRAELHYFHSPEAIPGGYAILSHTWGDREQTFQETQALREQCKGTDKTPRDLATPKTSSSELSEAINSMFRWYSSLAEACFAYLEEVESECVLDAPDSTFRTARLHSRGWTLQELIASSLVVFVSQDWKIIGNKLELAPLLQEVTGVPWQVLTGEEHYSSFSIAERMFWASKRTTTRIEDEAYCLMGLFSVNMPTIYGEGRQAFQRLQHEIMKLSFDTSLFAWGVIIGNDVETLVPSDPNVYTFMMTRINSTDFASSTYLLPASPSSFEIPGICYTPSAKNPLQPYPDRQQKNPPIKCPFGQFELPRVSLTSYGLECRFPIIESDGLIVAVLLCDTGREHIGLFLQPSNDPVQDLTRKKYTTAHWHWSPGDDFVYARLISLGTDLYNLRLNGKKVTPKWRDICVVDSPPRIRGWNAVRLPMDEDNHAQ